jgi:hypothetical protein
MTDMSHVATSDLEHASSLSSNPHVANPKKTAFSSEKKTEVLEDATLAFPDGGPQAWLNVLGAWLVTFTTFGYVCYICIP